MIELGFPFSDPLADGPVIQRASERALERGMRTAQCLDCLAATRAVVGETPIVPMTYAALLEAYGWERFAADASERGATSLIVSDVPAGQRPDASPHPPRRPELDRRADPGRRLDDRRVALPRHSDRDDRCERGALVGPRGPGWTDSLSCERRPLVRGLRHLDAGAGRRRGGAGRRRRRRVTRRSDRRGRPRRARSVRRLAPGGARHGSVIDAHALAASRATRSALRQEEPPALRDTVAEDATEVLLHGSGPTRTSIFPTFSPSRSPMKACGAFSMPSTMVSR